MMSNKRRLDRVSSPQLSDSTNASSGIRTNDAWSGESISDSPQPDARRRSAQSRPAQSRPAQSRLAQSGRAKVAPKIGRRSRTGKVRQSEVPSSHSRRVRIADTRVEVATTSGLYEVWWCTGDKLEMRARFRLLVDAVRFVRGNGRESAAWIRLRDGRWEHALGFDAAILNADQEVGRRPSAPPSASAPDVVVVAEEANTSQEGQPEGMLAYLPDADWSEGET